MFLRLIALLCLTIPPALFQGQMTDRWGTSEQEKISAELVGSVPKQLGSWTYVKDGPELSDGVIAELGVNKYIHRVYSNGKDEVTVLLMSGQTARLVRHTPDICYGSKGNTFLAEPENAEISVDGTAHQFLILPIRPQGRAADDYVVVYGFSADGQFDGPKSPRLAYHGKNILEKIQILASPNPEDVSAMPEGARGFIKELARYVTKSQ
ncbi:MAG: exosortase-associated EpsI family protein [Fuerstiella sp.]